MTPTDAAPDDADPQTEASLRHVGDPGTAEIVAPGELSETRSPSPDAPLERGVGEDAGYTAVPGEIRGGGS